LGILLVSSAIACSSGVAPGTDGEPHSGTAPSESAASENEGSESAAANGASTTANGFDANGNAVSCVKPTAICKKGPTDAQEDFQSACASAGGRVTYCPAETVPSLSNGCFSFICDVKLP